VKLLSALPIFSAAFAAIYAGAMYFNVALFVYYPAVNELHWIDQPNLPGPPMYWYGWIAYAILGAAIISGAALFLPPQWKERIFPRLSWAVPLLSMLFVLYVIRDWFFH
jgi:hypothetical protein